MSIISKSRMFDKFILRSNWQFLSDLDEIFDREYFDGKTRSEIYGDKYKPFNAGEYAQIKERIKVEIDSNPLFKKAFFKPMGVTKAISTSTTTTTTTTLPPEAINDKYLLKEQIDELVEKSKNIEDLFKQLINVVKKTVSPSLKTVVIIFIINISVLLVYDFLKPKIDAISKTKEGSIKSAIEETIIKTGIEKELLSNLRMVTAKKLNVRKKPTSQSSRIATLKYRNIVRLIEKSGRWFLVEYKSQDDNIHIQGWVYGRYITKLINE